jgi:hypothetical protein
VWQLLPKVLRPKSARPDIVKAALWLVANRAHCTYTEDADRVWSIKRPYHTPFFSDCSAGVTALYYWGNANDPNDADFVGPSDTGTLISHGKAIAAHKARSADVVIFGPGDGWHAVLVTQGGSDPWCWSMGEQGDPHIYRASVIEQAVAYVNHVETCQVRYFRYNTSLRR